MSEYKDKKLADTIILVSDNQTEVQLTKLFSSVSLVFLSFKEFFNQLNNLYMGGFSSH